MLLSRLFLQTVSNNKKQSFGSMPKYKSKNAKKPYDKSTSHETSAIKGKCAVLDARECRSKESPLQADPPKVVAPVEAGTCSQCQVSGRGLVQCECCDLWYCNVCCGITEDTLVLLGEAECLHFFCPPCEDEVFNLINKKNCEDSPITSSQKDILSVVTDTISKAISNLQSAMQTTITSLLGPRNQEQPMAMDDQFSHNPLSHRDEISQAVSSVLNEEKEKSKRRLNVILHNIPESNAENAEMRKQHDVDTAKAIVNQHLGIPASIPQTVRLGKKSDKPRLLRITVGSDEEKAEILRNCTKIRTISEPEYLSRVFITPDLTKKEREENKALRNKLKEMNNGQNKYQIKNGRIVPRRN